MQCATDKGKIFHTVSPTTVFPPKMEKVRTSCRQGNVRTDVCTSVSRLVNKQSRESYRSGRDINLCIYNHFPIKTRNKIEKKKLT